MSVYWKTIQQQFRAKFTECRPQIYAGSALKVGLHTLLDQLDKLKSSFDSSLGENNIAIHASSKISLLADGSMRFSRTAKSDEGLFQCRASNNIGNPLSKTVRISVNGNKLIKWKRLLQSIDLDVIASAGQSEDPRKWGHHADGLRGRPPVRSLWRPAVDCPLEAVRSARRPDGSIPADDDTVQQLAQSQPVPRFEH